MKSTLRVLHVEDSENDVALLTRYLSRAGYELISKRVDTAPAMRAAFETSEWDVILCDYSMPEFNALAALSVMREMGLDIPFIIISGTIGEGVAVEAMRAGVHDYLMKDSLTRLAPAIERELSEAENRRARQEAEEAVLTSERKYRLLFDSNPLPMWVFDRETLRFLAINEAAVAHYGFSREEFLAMTLEDIRPTEELPKLRYVLSQPMEGLKRTGIWKHRKKDGTLLDVEIMSHPLDFGGRSAVLTLANDITERIQAEEALRETKEKLRLFVAHAPAAIAMLDSDMKYIAASNRWLSDYNIKDPHIMGRSHFEIFPDVPDRWKEILGRCLAGTIERNDSDPWVRQDGHTEWVRWEVRPWCKSDGAIGGLIIFSELITERKQAEDVLRSKNEELTSMTQQLWQASKLATMGELSASIAHELNNPLATVALRVESLLMRLPEDSAQRKPLDIIAQEVDRMAVLVNNLLQFSRRSHRQISTLDPREEIVNSLELVHYHLRNRKIEVQQEFASELPTIQADRQQLRQLFLNLITNASDAMPKGGKLTVRAALEGVNGDRVVIEFADNGEGIAAANLQKIWDPFFTTKPEGKGTGLGLAICRRIMEEHEGTIEILSQSGGGTTVRMVFPSTNNGAPI